MKTAKVARAEALVNRFGIAAAISRGDTFSHGSTCFRENELSFAKDARECVLSLKNFGYQVVAEITPAVSSRGSQGYILDYQICW